MTIDYSTQPLFSYRPYWAKRLGVAPFLPMTQREMDILGWDACDVILVTGDAYVDHPSFGMALIGRLLEAQGFRVGIIAQPNWQSAEAFRALGKPKLYFGITAGNMDSMVNNYTADRKIRSDDAYSPNGAAAQRPDRAVIVYAQRCREAYSDSVIVLGGIEASLRRIAQYDYWSEKIRRSILLDAKADLLLYGNAERAIVALSHRLAAGEPMAHIRDLRGSVFHTGSDWIPFQDRDIVHADQVDSSQTIAVHENPYAEKQGGEQQTISGCAGNQNRPLRFIAKKLNDVRVIELPSFEEVSQEPIRYAQASRILHLETNPGNAKALRQRHGDRILWVNPPPWPLSTEELDGIFDLPYQRVPHRNYADAKIPAYEMIRFSVNIMRGCFGGCSFCSITEHEGRIIQSRSNTSILKEIENIRDRTPGFTGVISDIGGPTANMYRMTCKDKHIEASCRRLSCVYPSICKNLNTDHSPLIELYQQARQVNGVKHVFVASGVRYDLAVLSPEYVDELVQHHTGGYLKIAPEHTATRPLQLMMKPGIATYERFRQLFEKASRKAGKKQYLIPYFIAAHPGTTDEDMLELALWLKQNNFRPDQVQNFIPSPMALASAMYHSERNPLHPINETSEPIAVPKRASVRRLHKAFLRYHDPNNWPLLRKALLAMGRKDLIGNGERHLIPPETSVKQHLGQSVAGHHSLIRATASKPKKKLMSTSF